MPDLAVPKFRQNEKTLTAAERGTIYHGIMERIDFARAAEEGKPYLEEATEAMVQAGIFTEKEISIVHLSRIMDFFGTELGARCASAFAEGRLQRERHFNLLQRSEGEMVVVQGIIDCFFEEDGELVLLDYKTNWIDREKSFDEEADRLRGAYRDQIAIYSNALIQATGLPVKEAYLYLLGTGKSIKM